MNVGTQGGGAGIDIGTQTMPYFVEKIPLPQELLQQQIEDDLKKYVSDSRMQADIINGAKVVPAFGNIRWSGTNPDNPDDEFGLYLKNCECLKGRLPLLWKAYNPPKRVIPLQEKLLRAEKTSRRNKMKCKLMTKTQPRYRNLRGLSDDLLETMAKNNVGKYWQS